jgi:hypothetical protein
LHAVDGEGTRNVTEFEEAIEKADGFISHFRGLRL